MVNKIVLGILAVLLGGVIILNLFRKEEATEVFTVKYAYTMQSIDNEYDSITIPIFFDEKDSKYSYIDNIDSVYISGYGYSSKYDVVSYLYNGMKSYTTKEYFEYSLEIKPLTYNNSVNTAQAVIEITFVDNYVIELEIGDIFGFDRVNSTNTDISITGKYVTDIDSSVSTIDGLIIKVRNNLENDIYLHNFATYFSNICLVNNYITDVTLVSTNISSTFEEITGVSKVDIAATDCSGNVNIKVQQNEEVSLYLPLLYAKELVTTKMAFEINYYSLGMLNKYQEENTIYIADYFLSSIYEEYLSWQSLK